MKLLNTLSAAERAVCCCFFLFFGIRNYSQFYHTVARGETSTYVHEVQNWYTKEAFCGILLI